MHILGLMGMPRRVYTYPADLGWGGLNLSPPPGALCWPPGVAVFVVNLVIAPAARGRAPAPTRGAAAAWNGPCASPPPAYNFARTPVVEGRQPLWDGRGPAGLTGLVLGPARGAAHQRRRGRAATCAKARPSPTHLAADRPPLAVTVCSSARSSTSGRLVWGSIPLGALPARLVLAQARPAPAKSKRTRGSRARPAWSGGMKPRSRRRPLRACRPRGSATRPLVVGHPAASCHRGHGLRARRRALPLSDVDRGQWPLSGRRAGPALGTLLTCCCWPASRRTPG